jgi:hypothetical protein
VTRVVWTNNPSLERSVELLSNTGTVERVETPEEFARAMEEPNALAFVEPELFPEIDKLSPMRRRVVALCSDTLQSAVAWLQPYPWLHHVVSTSLLEQPLAAELLSNVAITQVSNKPRLLDWLGKDASGRRILMSQASKRAARLDRMSQFFADAGVGQRTAHQLCDAAEELLTNAFYDAPVTAGVFEKPISREIDVTLPEEFACDLAYATRGELALVRVRDPFGSLSRRRLVEVLSRCAQPTATVEVDESMGGAGLGMWRMFSTATFIAISIIKGRRTEILVGMTKKPLRPKPFAFHLFFADSDKPRVWRQLEDTTFPGGQHSIALKFDE